MFKWMLAIVVVAYVPLVAAQTPAETPAAPTPAQEPAAAPADPAPPAAQPPAAEAPAAQPPAAEAPASQPPAAEALATEPPAAQPAAPATPSAEPAVTSGKPRLWVAAVSATGLTPELVAIVNDALVSEAGQLPGFEVLGESDLAQLLSVEQRKQVLGCSDASCFTDLGKVANADRVLSCSARLFGDEVQLSCWLLGVKEGAQLASKDRKVVNRADAVAEAARALVGILLTGAPRERRGLVELKVSEPGAEVMVDGRVVGTSPLKDPLRVDEGKREIIVKKSGFATQRLRVEVQAGSFTTMDARLQATRGFVLWPFGAAALAAGLVSLVGATTVGLTAGTISECAYWGSIHGEVPIDALRTASAPLCGGVDRALTTVSRTSTPALSPAYRTRPIDNFTHETRQTQWLVAGVIADVAWGAGGFVALVALAGGVALIVTDVVVRALRSEE